MMCHNTIKTLPIQCQSMFLRKKSEYLNIKRFGVRLSHSYLKNDARTDGRYVNGELKTWKERIKTNFHGQDVPYNMHRNATAMQRLLKIDSVYKQGKNYPPQLYVEECKYIDAETQQWSMVSDDDDGLKKKA